jgi:hypothetical protein
VLERFLSGQIIFIVLPGLGFDLEKVERTTGLTKLLHKVSSQGGNMVGELDILNEWIPEQMQPGTVFVLENAGEIGEKEDPYWAVLACPSCGMLGLITRRQINGLIPVICGSEHCSAQFFIREAEVVVRKPF